MLTWYIIKVHLSKLRSQHWDIAINETLVIHMVKNLPAMQETQDPSLGREDPLEKGMATHSSILAWGIP